MDVTRLWRRDCLRGKVLLADARDEFGEPRHTYAARARTENTPPAIGEFSGVFPPDMLTTERAEAETVIELERSQRTVGGYWNREGMSAVTGAVAQCTVTVRDGTSPLVLASRTISGPAPPASIRASWKDSGEVLGAWPRESVEHYLQRLVTWHRRGYRQANRDTTVLGRFSATGLIVGGVLIGLVVLAVAMVLAVAVMTGDWGFFHSE